MQSEISIIILNCAEHGSSIHFQSHIKQRKTSLSILNTEIGNKFRFTLSRIKKRSTIFASRTEGEAAGLQLSAPNANLRNEDFVVRMISKVLRDIHCTLNQPLISVDDRYTGILKKYNKNLRICRFFLCQLVLTFPVTLLHVSSEILT